MWLPRYQKAGFDLMAWEPDLATRGNEPDKIIGDIIMVMNIEKRLGGRRAARRILIDWAFILPQLILLFSLTILPFFIGMRSGGWQKEILMV